MDLPENRFERVRVIDENLDPKADLLPGQHALVDLAPGKHQLFAYAWGNEARPQCVGALEVSVEPNRVYVARLSRGTWHGYVLPSGTEVGCLDLDLRGVNGVAQYIDLVPRLRVSERAIFLTQRLSLPWVDGYGVRSAARAAGLQRKLRRLDESDGLDNLP